VFAHLAAFLGVSVVVIVTPGPDTALTVRNALVGGRRAALLTAVGVCTGLTVWSVAASAGLAAVVAASEPAFLAIKLVGAAYLLWLGGRALRDAVRARPHGEGPRSLTSRMTPRIAYRQGVFSNLGNPKIAVFFTSLLPQFVPKHASFADLLVLGLLFVSLTLAWLAPYAVVAARAGDVLRRPRVRRIVDSITGLALVGFGLRLATERRA
jgi:threonine/homoserine/homoserine lactone efflux protein